MALRGLSWRFGVPFLTLVVASAIALAVYLSAQVAAEQRRQLAHLAEANVRFFTNNSMRATEDLARNLQQVTGCAVAFRRGTTVDASAGEFGDLAAVAVAPVDGEVRRVGELDMVAAPYGDGRALVLARPAGELLDPQVAWMLGLFLLLAGLLASLAVRGLVLPLRGLAAQLPHITSEGPLRVSGRDRPDEIGEVARAFERARAALADERDQRARMEKLAVLGRMTAALAHEIQNPVSAIQMHAQLLRGTAAEPEGEVIEREARRIDDLVNQWMFTSRPEPPRLGSADLGELLTQIVRSLRPRLEHARVTATLETHGDLRLSCDHRRLHQVFTNLLTNAMQAMPKGGAVALAATGRADDVVVTVTDQGPGLSATALQRFGEYFFSEREGGMGIGLGVAKAIVEAHGGVLRAANAPAGGAVVTVLLPRRAPQGTP